MAPVSKIPWLLSFVSKPVLQNFPSSLRRLHGEKEGKKSEQGAGSPQNFLELKVWARWKHSSAWCLEAPHSWRQMQRLLPGREVSSASSGNSWSSSRMVGAAGSSVTTRTHQLILELHKQFNRVILSTEPRNPLAGCGADTEQRGSGERERQTGRGQRDTSVQGTGKCLCPCLCC